MSQLRSLSSVASQPLHPAATCRTACGRSEGFPNICLATHSVDLSGKRQELFLATGQGASGIRYTRCLSIEEMRSKYQQVSGMDGLGNDLERGPIFSGEEQPIAGFAVSGEEDDLACRISFSNPDRQLDAVHFGQHNIHDQQCRLPNRHYIESIFGRTSSFGLIPGSFKDLCQSQRDDVLVIDDKYSS